MDIEGVGGPLRDGAMDGRWKIGARQLPRRKVDAEFEEAVDKCQLDAERAGEGGEVPLRFLSRNDKLVLELIEVGVVRSAYIGQKSLKVALHVRCGRPSVI